MAPGAVADAAAAMTFAELRAAVAEQLERLSSVLMRTIADSDNAETRSTRDAIQARIALLGQLAAALATATSDALPRAGAALGSEVLVEDERTSDQFWLTLMDGALIDLDASQVSLASPLGHSLLGKVEGQLAFARTPQGPRALRIIRIRRLEEILAEPMPQPRPVP